MIRRPPRSTLFPTRRSSDLLQNFLDCVRSGKQPTADALTAHLTCALVHLGEIAYRTERVLHFDPKAETILRDKEARSEEHTSELQSRLHLVCRLLLEKKKKQ